MIARQDVLHNGHVFFLSTGLKPFQSILHRVDSPVDVFRGGLPVAHRYSHAAFALPGGAAKECLACLLYLFDDPVRPPVMVGFSGAGGGVKVAHQPLTDPRLADQLRAR